MTEKKKQLSYTSLRKIDVSTHIEKKGKFNYLSWAAATDILLEHDSEAKWWYDDNVTFSDGSMMVFCTVKAFGKERKMQLPVLNYQNKVITKPTAFDINTAMHRCLAKAIALHGIGLYIYMGEDIPPDSDKPTEKQTSRKVAPKKEPAKPDVNVERARNWIKAQLQEFAKFKTGDAFVEWVEGMALDLSDNGITLTKAQEDYINEAYDKYFSKVTK